MSSTKVPHPLGVSDIRLPGVGLGELFAPWTLGSGGEDPPMMIYQETISPSLAPLSEDERMKLVTEAIAGESHWAKGLVARIAVVIREIQQP
jgi:hypothetical protein